MKKFICFNDAKKICGKEYGVDEVFKEVLKDKAFYETSEGGVTFSGGECMLQIEFLSEILKKCKENRIHTAVDTAGNVPWQSFEKIMSYVDLFLYDIKCITEEMHIKGTGVSNKHILDNLKKLTEVFKGRIIVRVPVIEGFNADINEMIKISEFVKKLNITNVELLPYHKMGEHKYSALNMNTFSFNVPEKEKIESFNQLFRMER